MIFFKFAVGELTI